MQVNTAPDHHVNEQPAVYVYEGFASAAEAEALITAAQDGLGRALVSQARAGAESLGRTGENCWLRHDTNPLINGLCKRLSALVGLPLEHAESLQVVHYTAGQQYAPHFDAWDAATERGRRCMARGGQRLVTCLLYLNSVQRGGGTGFPKLDVEIMAKRGRLLVFHNCYAESEERHPHSLHTGLPVLQGDKWVCNLWFRAQPYQTAAAQADSGQTYSRRI